MTWKKGQSGNPTGRKYVGAKDGRMALRSSISKEIPEIIKTLIASAKAGDVQAARTLLERVLPPLKPEGTPIVLHELEAAATPLDQLLIVVQALARGQVLPDDARQILAGIAQVATALKPDETERRIKALEARTQ